MRRSWLQADGLPFAEVLPAEAMQAAFDDEGALFHDWDENSGGLVFTPASTLRALLSQMLFMAEQRSCRAAVIRVAADFAMFGRPVSQTSTAHRPGHAHER